MRPDSNQDLVDYTEIRRVIQSWGFWRDSYQWDLLKDAYTPDGRMSSGASSGTIDQFIDFSKATTAKSRFRPYHFIGASVIQVNGSKAIAETRMKVLLRGIIQEVEVDVTAYARLYDRFLRYQGHWRIKERTPIYDKDRLDPVHPGTSVVIDPAVLARYPREYRYMSYLNDALGVSPANVTLPTGDSPAEAKLRSEGAAWLALPCSEHEKYGDH